VVGEYEIAGVCRYVYSYCIHTHSILIRIHIHAHIHSHSHKHIQTHIFTYAHICLHIFTYLHMRTHIFTLVHIHNTFIHKCTGALKGLSVESIADLQYLQAGDLDTLGMRPIEKRKSPKALADHLMGRSTRRLGGGGV
jgi:hypothetical protein